MKVTLKNVKPNPFRQIERYPIDRERVRTLRESINQTGFWDNIVARENGSGGVEIAYGHHRLVALREEYSATHKVDLIVRPLSDEAMLKIMARENMAEWATLAPVLMETVRAIVDAYAVGKIMLKPVPKGTTGGVRVRVAPSFTPVQIGKALLHKGLGHGKLSGNLPTYTAHTLADFLGAWQKKGQPKQWLDDALTALGFIEEGLLQEKQFIGLNAAGMRGLVAETRKTKRMLEAEARELEKEAKAKGTPSAKAANLQKQAKAVRASAKKEAREVGEAVARELQNDQEKETRGKGRKIERAQEVAEKVRARSAPKTKSLWPRYQEEPQSIRKFVDRLRKQTIPFLNTLGSREKAMMSPEAGRFIAALYRKAAEILAKKAEQYEEEFKP
jgi:hypothetical protein